MSAAGRFAGRAVVITGASGDIGRVVARAFAREGASLGLVSGRNPRALDPVVASLNAEFPGRAIAVAGADLLAPQEAVASHVRDACATLRDRLGNVDVLVALAGLPSTPALWNKSFSDVTAADLHAAFAVDTVGTFLFAQALERDLRATHGAIVVTSSAAAFLGDVWGLAYAPAKSANAGLVKTLARVLAPEVRVNGIAPGGIDTAWVGTLPPDGREHAARQALLRRLGTPGEVATLVLDLAAPGYVNGQTILMDGGVFPAPPDPPKQG